jgi:hypothetical protein
MSLTMIAILISLSGIFIAALLSCLSIGQQEDEQREVILEFLMKNVGEKQHSLLR